MRKRFHAGKRNRGGNLPAGCLSLFGLPFLAAGLFLSWLYFAGFATWWQARTWEEVPCWIESAELRTSRGDDSTTYQAMATYRYHYAGKMWRSDQVSLESGSDNIGSFHQSVHRELSRHVQKLPATPEMDAATVAPAFRCYVNPANPSEAVLYRTLRWEMQAFKAVFALTFPAIGAGLVFGGLIGAGISRKENLLKQSHPGEPWRWKRDWAGDTIPERASHWAPALHLYTLWSALIISCLIAATWLSGAFRESPSSWWVLVFAGFWCIPAMMSFRRLRQRMMIGKARFEPSRIPIQPGSTLDGAIVLDRPLPLRAIAEISLICERTVSTTSSNSENSVSTERVWSRSTQIPSLELTRDVSGFRIPLSFPIPADAPVSGGEPGPGGTHAWKLELKVPATPIRAAFDLPVFQPGGAVSPPPAAIAGDSPTPSSSIHEDLASDLPARLAERRIQAEFAADGSPLSIICPPARNRSLLLFLIFFDVIWTAVAVLMILQDAPLIFRLVWPLSASAIWLIILWTLLHKRSVSFLPAELQVRNQLGPYAWNRTLDKSSILAFHHDSNMSSNNTRFYRIRAEDVLGRHTTLVDNLVGEGTAASLAKRMETWRTGG
jgi:hypothetical protein